MRMEGLGGTPGSSPISEAAGPCADSETKARNLGWPRWRDRKLRKEVSARSVKRPGWSEQSVAVVHQSPIGQPPVGMQGRKGERGTPARLASRLRSYRMLLRGVGVAGGRNSSREGH